MQARISFLKLLLTSAGEGVYERETRREDRGKVNLFKLGIFLLYFTFPSLEPMPHPFEWPCHCSAPPPYLATVFPIAEPSTAASLPAVLISIITLLSLTQPRPLPHHTQPRPPPQAQRCNWDRGPPGCPARRTDPPGCTRHLAASDPALQAIHP